MHGLLRDEIRIDPRAVALALKNSIGARLAELKKDGIVLGLSGGVDSAVTAALCVRAVGAERVAALLLPERDSDPVHQRHALMLARQLGIRARIRNLTPVLEHFAVYGYSPLRFLPRFLQEKLTRAAYQYQTRKKDTHRTLKYSANARRARGRTGCARLRPVTV